MQINFVRHKFTTFCQKEGAPKVSGILHISEYQRAPTGTFSTFILLGTGTRYTPMHCGYTINSLTERFEETADRLTLSFACRLCQTLHFKERVDKLTYLAHRMKACHTLHFLWNGRQAYLVLRMKACRNIHLVETVDRITCTWYLPCMKGCCNMHLVETVDRTTCTYLAP